MAWRQTGDNLLSERILAKLTDAYIRVTRLKWHNSLRPVDVWLSVDCVHIGTGNAPVTSHPGPRTGCSRAVFNKNRTSPHGARTGPVRILPPRTGPVEFSCMHYKLTGTVVGPYGPRADTCDTRTGFLQILLVSIPLRVRKGTIRHPWGSRTGPVGYEKHWRFPCGGRKTPARASHGVHMEACELFDQTISVQLYQAVGVRSLMWPREQHRRKIPTGASLGLAGNKSYGR